MVSSSCNGRFGITARRVCWQYDGLDRLTQGVETLTWDAVGRLIGFDDDDVGDGLAGRGGVTRAGTGEALRAVGGGVWLGKGTLHRLLAYTGRC